MSASTDKNQILEPITAVSRLITLAFKPKNTKVAIRDHNIVLCEPKSESYYGLKVPQALGRYWNGDSREDIFVLNHVICNFIMWYIIPNKHDISLYKGLINLAKYLRVGLKELQYTYKSGNSVGTLQYYINVLSDVIDDRFSPDRLYISSPSKQSVFLDEQSIISEDEDDLNYSTIIDVDKFKNFWTFDELLSLCSQFDNCFRDPTEPDKITFRQPVSNNYDFMDEMIDPVEIINTNDIKEDSSSNILSDPLISSKQLVPKPLMSDGENSDEKIISLPTPSSKRSSIDRIEKSEKSDRKVISPHKNTHTFENFSSSGQKSWPVPKKKRNVIVSSSLVGISQVLDIMDKKFTLLLSQSYKGV